MDVYSRRNNQLANTAILAQNLCKRYGSEPPVLQNFSMTLPTGTIYSLLGSSGCGKTTLISCIVGLTKFEAGRLCVLGKQTFPWKENSFGKAIGFMPQELALHGQLTTYENLSYFGQLYGMNKKKISESYVVLQTLLDLPDNSKQIRDMSGGQQRRISLAVALLHNPQILILDEPTVGLDPVLREKIQDYLRNIANTQNCTILITTHYIEEARYSDIVGVMRNGRLIAEDSPLNLLEIHKCDLLQDVVTSLCQGDSNSPTTKITNVQYGPIIANETLQTIKNVDSIDYAVGPSRRDIMCQRGRNIYGLAATNIITFIRYPTFLFTLLLLPTIQCGLSLWILGHKIEEVPFGIVNKELHNWAVECDTNKTFENACNLYNLSCRFLKKLAAEHTVKWESYKTEHLAVHQVHVGNICGYITIPENFSESLVNRATEHLYALNETLAGSQISVWLDYSQQLTSKLLTKHLYETFTSFAVEISMSCGITSADVKLPLDFRTPVYGDYSNSYRDFMLPGTLILSIFSLTVLLSGLSFVADYKQGTFLRARVAGLTIVDTIIGHMVVQLLVALVQTTILTETLSILFDFTFAGSKTLYYCICLLSGISATSIGLLLGIASRDETGVFILGLLIYPMCMYFGAAFFSTQGMSWYWQQFANILPATFPITAMRSVLLRNAGWTHSLVWPGIISLIAWPVGLTIVIIIIYKLQYLK